MLFSTTTVDIALVEDRSDQLRITTRRDIGTLAESIQQLGLINPPILRASAAGYTVVAGFRRVEACRRLGKNALPARLPATALSELHYVQLAISDNALQRPLNTLELARCFRLLSTFYPQQNALTEAGSRLGLPSGRAYVRKLLILAGLPENIQLAVGRGDISLAMVEAMRHCDSEDAAALALLYTKLRPSLNKQREIYQLCREIARREGTTIAKLIESPRLKEIAADENLDANRRTAMLRSMLKRRRMPALSEALDEFQREVAELKLGKGVSLTPPPGFEGRTYRLSIEFSSRQDLEGHLDNLKKLSASPAMTRILARRRVAPD